MYLFTTYGWDRFQVNLVNGWHWFIMKATVVVVMCCLQDVVFWRCGTQAVVWCRTMKCGSVVSHPVMSTLFTAGKVRAIHGDLDLAYQATCSILTWCMMEAAHYGQSIWGRTDVYRFDIEEPAGRWQEVKEPWRVRREPQVVRCWGPYILWFGGVSLMY